MVRAAIDVASDQTTSGGANWNVEHALTRRLSAEEAEGRSQAVHRNHRRTTEEVAEGSSHLYAIVSF